MKAKPGKIISQIAIWLVVLLFALSCLLPLLNMVAISLSGSDAVAANKVGLWPVDFTITTYNKLLGDSQFWHSFWISVKRVVIGTLINMFFTISMAYPLSKSKKRFRAREIYMKIVIFAMLFNGGVIPLFMVVSKLHLNNTIWSLVSLPALATVGLFAIVNHWNDYFSGLIYMSKASMYPLQTYIQQLTVDLTQITDADQLKQLSALNNRSFNAAKIVVSTIPLLIIYPFLQKYFVTGMVIGAVKE